MSSLLNHCFVYLAREFSLLQLQKLTSSIGSVCRVTHLKTHFYNQHPKLFCLFWKFLVLKICFHAVSTWSSILIIKILLYTLITFFQHVFRNSLILIISDAEAGRSASHFYTFWLNNITEMQSISKFVFFLVVGDPCDSHVQRRLLWGDSQCCHGGLHPSREKLRLTWYDTFLSHTQASFFVFLV